MDQMMKQANDEMLSDQEFGEEIILMYTDVHRKRYIAEQNMIRKFRDQFKRGDTYGMTILDTIFPDSQDQTKEQIYRQQVAMERMERKMKEMEERWNQVFLNQSKQIETLTQEKAHIQEQFYDCQAEMIQQKEYVAILQEEDAIRKRRMLQYNRKIKNSLQTIEDGLDGIERTLVSLSHSPYNVLESLNQLKERKKLLLKQKKGYNELLGFLD
jgi:hypothetical protein